VYPWSRQTRVGQGLTADLSGSGLLLKTDEPPPPGVAIEVWIDWPYLLQGVCRLEVYMTGRVVSVDSRGVAIAVETHEFRTRGERSFAYACQMPSTSIVG
jgi:PilZ domain-containing protein